MLINLVAYHLTGAPNYKAKSDRLQGIARWKIATSVGVWKRKIRHGKGDE